jgi:hypothetical protein
MAPTMAFIKQRNMLAEEPEDNGPVFTGGSYSRHRRLQRKATSEPYQATGEARPETTPKQDAPSVHHHLVSLRAKP